MDDSTETDSESEAGDCQPFIRLLVCSAAAWLLPKPLNYSWPPTGPAVWLQPFDHPAAARLRQTHEMIAIESILQVAELCHLDDILMFVFHWWITIKHICPWHLFYSDNKGQKICIRLIQGLQMTHHCGALITAWRRNHTVHNLSYLLSDVTIHIANMS